MLYYFLGFPLNKVLWGLPGWVQKKFHAKEEKDGKHLTKSLFPLSKFSYKVVVFSITFQLLIKWTLRVKKSRRPSYSGGMYPNVPTRRVGIDVLPTSVSFVKPKSATCTNIISLTLTSKSFHKINHKDYLQ